MHVPSFLPSFLPNAASREPNCERVRRHVVAVFNLSALTTLALAEHY